MRKLFVLLMLLVLLTPVAAQARTILQDEAAQAGWREDVDYLVEQIFRVHPNPTFRYPEARFQMQAQQLKAEIPYMTDNQIILELACLAAMVDGHTYLFTLQEKTGFHLYPIRIYPFAEGFYVVNAGPEYANLIGARLLSINGVDIHTVYDILAPYSSSDNLQGLLEWVPSIMMTPESLQAKGIIDKLDEPNMQFETSAGDILIVNFAPISMNEYMRWNPGGMWKVIGLPQQKAPLYLSNKAENFWYTYLEDSQTLYIQYNHVYSTTPSGMSMVDLGNVVRNMPAENPVERIVVDLRHNGGGNNMTYGPFIHALATSDLNQPGKLFVIIGRSTFSAAKDFALDLSRRANPIFVGEPTSGMPNNYGDPVTRTLPNSGLQVAIATRYTERALEGDTHPWLAPDIIVLPTAADFFSGRDAALEAVLNYDPAALAD